MVDFNNLMQQGEAKAREILDKRAANKGNQQGQGRQQPQNQNQQSDSQQPPGT